MDNASFDFDFDWTTKLTLLLDCMFVIVMYSQFAKSEFGWLVVL